MGLYENTHINKLWFIPSATGVYLLLRNSILVVKAILSDVIRRLKAGQKILIQNLLANFITQTSYPNKHISTLTFKASDIFRFQSVR